MPKATEKGKKVTGTNIRGEAECAKEGITQLPLIPVKQKLNSPRQSCLPRCEQLGKNGNKLDRKQYKLLSGLHDQL